MKPIYTRYRTVGLLGGSFNPAHAGHLHITEEAIKKLGLDAVWWLVTPQNPLKASSSLAPYPKRFESAQHIAGVDARIHVSDFEAATQSRYSYQTIRRLKQRYPGTRFVWLIGADNLVHFHRWQRWQQIFCEIPVVVFDRSPHSHRALRSRAASYMQRFHNKGNRLRGYMHPPCLSFLHIRRHGVSSTWLRKTLGEKAFMGHNKDAKAL